MKFIRKRSVILAALAFLLFVLILNSVFSVLLYRSRGKIIKYASETIGYRINLDNITFGFLSGIRIKGLSLYYAGHDKEAVYVKEASVLLSLPALLKKKIAVKRVHIYEAVLFSKKEKEGVNLQVIFSGINKRIQAPAHSPFKISTDNSSVFISSMKVVSVDNEYRPTGTELAFSNTLLQTSIDKGATARPTLAPGQTRIGVKGEGRRVNAEGKIRLICHFSPGNFQFGFLNNLLKVEEEMDFSLEGNQEGRDLNIEFLKFTIGNEEIAGFGLIKDFTERNPLPNIKIIDSVISLNNIKFLEHSFGRYDSISFSARISGKMDDIKLYVSAVLNNCTLKYPASKGRILKIENMDGRIEYSDGYVRLDGFQLKLGKVPLAFNLKISANNEPDIYLDASLSKEFFDSQDLPIKKLNLVLDGKIKNTLTGSLRINALYARKDSVFNLQANLGGLEFDYLNPQEKFFKIENLALLKENAVDEPNPQRLNFSGFSARINLAEKKLDIKDIKFNGYNGRLWGEINFSLIDKAMLKFVLNSRGLDVYALMRDMYITKKILSGKLDTKVFFNNLEKDFLRGTCYIRNGIVDLDVLANTVNLPPLKDRDFNTAHVYFAVSKKLIKIRGVRLSGPDLIMNAYWNINSRINGNLNLKIASEVLKKSAQFNKLFLLTKIKRPYIDFKFLLGGIPDAMRIMWLKGEFKEKLEETLPPRIKRAIEVNLNKLINEELAK